MRWRGHERNRRPCVYLRKQGTCTCRCNSTEQPAIFLPKVVVLWCSLPQQFLVDVARERNATPLPLIPEKFGPRLPPERYCLTANNYKVKERQKPVSKDLLISKACVLYWPKANTTTLYPVHAHVFTIYTMSIQSHSNTIGISIVHTVHNQRYCSYLVRLGWGEWELESVWGV